MKKRILVSQIAAIAVIAIAKPASWTWFTAGLCVMILGQVIRLSASAAIVKSKTLTVTGPYAAVRNPLYLGTTFMMLGLLLSLSNPLEPVRSAAAWFIAAVSFTLIYKAQIKAEEIFLLETYGEEFKKYMASVNSIFPSVSSVSGFFDTSAYSKEVFRKNKEWRGIFGLLAAALVVAVRIKFGF